MGKNGFDIVDVEVYVVKSFIVYFNLYSSVHHLSCLTFCIVSSFVAPLLLFSSFFNSCFLPSILSYFSRKKKRKESEFRRESV